MANLVFWSLSPLFQRAWTLLTAACGDNMQLTFVHLADV